MSDYIDKAKHLAKDLGEKARDAVTGRSETIDGGIDKAAEFVDDKTGGKYSEKIGTVRSKAHDVVEKITKEDGDTASDETPPDESSGSGDKSSGSPDA